MDYKEKFMEAYALIKRPGADKLLHWLETETDFFDAPASTRFHGSYPGGLLAHSVHVYWQLKKLIGDGEQAALLALLHDICKANTYGKSFRNVKNEETGKWEKVPSYVKKDLFPYGHGEKSVYLIMKHMELSDEEAMAIRWHMGAFENATGFSDAARFSPLVWELHDADMRATMKEEQHAT